MSDQLPDDWTPERLARFEAWQQRQSGTKTFREQVQDAFERMEFGPPTPLQEGITPPPLDGYGRGPSSPFYRPKGDPDASA